MDKEKQTADKCDFCSTTRLARGEAPACVSVCPTDALVFGRINSPEVQQWLADHPNVYQDEKENTGKLHMYRNREVHND
jgi:thiosulfate reductase electron transport protein